MNYIYLTNKSIEATKEDIESGKLILDDSHIEKTDKIWIISKEQAEMDATMMVVKGKKVGIN